MRPFPKQAKGPVQPEISSNLLKHTSPNPVQRWLLRRFHQRVAELVKEGLWLTSEGARDPSRSAAGKPHSVAGGGGNDRCVNLRSGGQPQCHQLSGRAPRTSDSATPLVLDVGCGEGFVARFLAARLQIRVVGLDIRRDALPDLVGAAEHLPLRDGVAPVVICLEVLEHLQNPWDTLEELLRVSSGYVILSVPDQPFFAMANLVRGKNLRRFGEDEEHLWHWRSETFLGFLGKRCHIARSVRSFPWVLALAKGSRR